MINLELPDLPYSKDALAPYMSAETLELHHDKHHMAYVTNGNKFIKENNLNEESIEEIVKNSYNNIAPVFNNVSQHLNHMHFWEIMKNNPNANSFLLTSNSIAVVLQFIGKLKMSSLRS